jgi:metallo-beta-lactamase class B
MVYADSLSLLSHDGYRYGDPAHPERLDAFRQGLNTIAALPCDILMLPHPDAIDFLARARQRAAGQKNDPLIDRRACKAYAAKGQKNLDQRLAKEATEMPAR